jgi:hypothetical protein
MPDDTMNRSPVPAWLEAEGTKLEAGFRFKAWLETGGDPEIVQPFLAGWLNAHGTRREARFVLKAWLDAGGRPAAIQPFIGPWLQAHEQDPEASFIFQAWLEAGGRSKVIRKSLHNWLASHAGQPNAYFVFSSWLAAAGNFNSIKEPASLWLRANPKHHGTLNIINHLARQADLPEDTLRDILAWCREAGDAEAALASLTYLEGHLRREEVAAEVAATARAWVEAVLGQEAFSPRLSALLALLFAILGDSPELREATGDLYLRWLRHPSALSPQPAHATPGARRIYFSAQRLSLLSYLEPLLASGRLSVAGHREALVHLFAWVKTWTPEVREQVGPFLERMRRLGG